MDPALTDLLGTGACFGPQALIRILSGEGFHGEVPAALIRAGDRIATAESTYSKVVCVIWTE